MTIAVVGTSIEHGTWLAHPSDAWPQQLAARLGQAVLDRSLPGGCWTAPNENGETIRSRLDTCLATDHPATVIIGGPPNDMVRTDDMSSVEWAVQNALAACVAAGVTHIVLVACLPFNDGGALTAGWWPTMESRRSRYNSWVQAADAEANVDVISFDSWLIDPTSGSTRCDSRFYSDGLHPNVVGAAIIGAAFPLSMLP